MNKYTHLIAISKHREIDVHLTFSIQRPSPPKRFCCAYNKNALKWNYYDLRYGYRFGWMEGAPLSPFYTNNHNNNQACSNDRLWHACPYLPPVCSTFYSKVFDDIIITLFSRIHAFAFIHPLCGLCKKFPNGKPKWNKFHSCMCLICVRGKMTQLPSVVASFASCERHIFLFFVPLVSRSLTNCHAISHQLFTHTNCNQPVVRISLASRGNFARSPLVAHHRQQPSASMNNFSYTHKRADSPIVLVLTCGWCYWTRAPQPRGPNSKSLFSQWIAMQ